MSKEVLTSVNKEHLDNILDGRKTVEWRKKPLPLGKHYGYETKNKCGCGKVTGEFEVVENIKVDLFDIVCNDEKDLIKKGCVDWGFLNKYAGLERSYLYANVIENAKRYDKPKELSEFYLQCEEYGKTGTVDIPKKCKKCRYQYTWNLASKCRIDGLKPITKPPQSWCYVEV